jgi:hypothetical protein
MTREEAVDSVEQQRMKVRMFGEYDRDASWVIMDHGVVVGSFEDLASAVVAVRDYVVGRAQR